MSYLPIVLTVVVIAIAVYFVERRMNKRKNGKLVAEFQSWAETKVTDIELKRWLLAQDSAESVQQLNELRKFCKRENIDLSLVLQGKLDNRAGLQTQADTMATTFFNAAQARTLMHEDLKAFAFYSAYAKSPKKRRYQKTFIPNLFLRLVDEGLADAPSLDDSMKLSERKRRQMAREAIAAAAEKDPVQFNRALKRTLFSAEETPAVEATPVVATA